MPDNKEKQVKTIKINRYSSALEAVTKNGMELARVSEKVIDSANEKKVYELHMAAVSQNGQALKFVPYEYQEMNMIKTALKQNGCNIEYSAVQDNEMFLLAIENNPDAVKFLSSGRLTGDLSGQNTSDLTSEASEKLIPLINRAIMYEPRTIRHFKDTATIAMWERCLAADPYVIIYHPAPPQAWLYKAVTEKPEIIANLNPDFIDDSVQIIAVKKNPKLIKDIKAPCVEAQITAVEKMPELIDEISLPCEKVCLFIIEKHPEYIRKLHGKLTENVQTEAIKKDPEYLSYIVAGGDVSENVIITAMKQDGLLLRHVTDGQTSDIISTALENNSSAYAYINEQTSEWFEYASQRHPEILQNVFEKEHREHQVTYTPTENQILGLLSKDGLLLRFIPKDKQTEKLCTAACEQNIKAFEYVKIDIPALKKRVLAEDGLMLRFIPADILTDDDISNAVEQNPDAVIYVKNKTADICMKAVSARPELLRVIDRNLMTEELILAALKKKPELLAEIPPEKQNAEMCDLCVAASNELINAAAVQTEEACITVLKKDVLMWKHITNRSRNVSVCALNAACDRFDSETDKNIRSTLENIMREILNRTLKPECSEEQMTKRPELIRFYEKGTDKIILSALEKDINYAKYIAVPDTVWKTFIIKHPECIDRLPRFIPSAVAEYSVSHPEYITEKDFSTSDIKCLLECRPDLIEQFDSETRDYDKLCLTAARISPKSIMKMKNVSENLRISLCGLGEDARKYAEKIYKDRLKKTEYEKKIREMKKRDECIEKMKEKHKDDFSRYNLDKKTINEVLIKMYENDITFDEYVSRLILKDNRMHREKLW